VFGKTHPMYVTGELTVKFLSPVPVGAEIEGPQPPRRGCGKARLLRGGDPVRRNDVRPRQGKFVPMSPEGTRT